MKNLIITGLMMISALALAQQKPSFKLESQKPFQAAASRNGNNATIFEMAKKNDLDLNAFLKNQTFEQKEKVKANIEKGLKSGNEGGGGGNVCILGHRAPMLLELSPKDPSEYYAQGEPGERLQKTKFLLEAGIANLTDNLEEGSSPLYTPRLKEEVSRILTTRLASSPVTASLIQKFLENVHFFGVDTGLKKSFGADYTETPLCSELNTQAVIFNLGGASVFVEMSVWNRLDLSTQAFTLVHEGFRFVQAIETYGGEYQMTNSQLQQIVAKIQQGTLQENLDNSIFIPMMDGSLKPIAEDPQLSLITNSYISIKSAGSTLSWDLMLLKEYIFDEKEKAFPLGSKYKKYKKMLAIFKEAIRSTIEADIEGRTNSENPLAKAYVEINKLTP